MTQLPAGASRPLPAWMREVDFALSLHSHLLLTGNVRDLYQLERSEPGEQPRRTYVPIGGALWHLCKSRGYVALATLDPVTSTLHVRPPEAVPEVLRPFTGKRIAAVLDLSDRDSRSVVDLMQAVVSHEGPPIALLFPYVARMFPAAGLPRAELMGLMGQIEALGHMAEATLPPSAPDGEAVKAAPTLPPYNTVFWLCERQEDLHPGFPLNSRALRQIRVPVPTLDGRREAADYAMRTEAESSTVAGSAEARDSDAVDAVEAARSLAEVTHGMTVREVFACGDVVTERALSPERYAEAARLLRVGVTDDPWSAEALRHKISKAETYLNQRVLGQERAVGKTMDVLYRSAVGLNGAHLSSSPNRPRGVLFLAGPTGVGKTELAKGIASLVLGGDAEPIRFDMSEFRADEAHQRLIGAPPGYVGFDAGGELTNAVRANPVSVLLFDEIEKAHPRIFDLFLQILEDGRLTDGRGATVHFTECFLVFTSNLGVAERQEKESGTSTQPMVNPGMDARQVEEILRGAYEEFFNRGIGRPELRNRFGDSYVVLDYIRRSTVEKIVDKGLLTVAARIGAVQKAVLVVEDEVRDRVIEEALGKIGDGGRGINNVIEASVVNPLARHLFLNPVAPGGKVRLSGLEFDDDHGWVLVVR